MWTQEFCPRTFLLAVVGPGMTVGWPTQGNLWPFASPRQHKLIPNFGCEVHLWNGFVSFEVQSQQKRFWKLLLELLPL